MTPPTVILGKFLDAGITDVGANHLSSPRRGLSTWVMADEQKTYHYGMQLDVAEVLPTNVPKC